MMHEEQIKQELHEACSRIEFNMQDQTGIDA